MQLLRYKHGKLALPSCKIHNTFLGFPIFGIFTELEGYTAAIEQLNNSLQQSVTRRRHHESIEAIISEYLLFVHKWMYCLEFKDVPLLKQFNYATFFD